MPATKSIEGTKSRVHAIRVWDPLVRLIHWSLAGAVLVNGVLTESDGILHQWIGYTALGLVAVRLVWGLVGSRNARFSVFPPNPAAALRHLADLRRGDRSVHLSHNPLGALMAYNLWATVLLLVLTGFMLGTDRYFAVAWVEGAHEMAFNWLIFSFVLHLVGVLLDTRRSGVPLFRAMIDGKKRVPDNRPLR